MKGQEYDVNVKCPSCEDKLVVYDYTYDEEECDTDTVLEWECPNGCKFNNEEIDVIDEEVNMVVSKCVCG